MRVLGSTLAVLVVVVSLAWIWTEKLATRDGEHAAPRSTAQDTATVADHPGETTNEAAERPQPDAPGRAAAVAGDSATPENLDEQAPTGAEVDDLVIELRAAALEDRSFGEIKSLLERLHAMDSPAARAAMADLLTDFSFDFDHRAMAFGEAVLDPCPLVRAAATAAAERQIHDGFNSAHHLAGYVSIIGRNGGPEDAEALERFMDAGGAAGIQARYAVRDLADRSHGADLLKRAAESDFPPGAAALYDSLAHWDDDAISAEIESAAMDSDLPVDTRGGALEALARGVELLEVNDFATKYYTTAASEDDRLVAVKSWEGLRLHGESDDQTMRYADAMTQPLSLALTDNSSEVQRTALQFLRNRDHLVTQELVQVVANSALADSKDGRAILAMWERSRARAAGE